MKKIKYIVTCVINVILMVILTSCSGISKKETYPSNYEQFSSLIGETKESICEKLCITEQDMLLSNIGRYDIPQKAEYIDNSFDMQLLFDVTNNKMYTFIYSLSFENEPNNAVATVNELLNHLNDVYGEANSHRGLSEWLDKQENLAETFAGDQFFSILEVWDLSDRANSNTQNLMNAYKETGFRNVEYLMSLECFYDGDSLVILRIGYGLTAYPMSTNLTSD